MKKRKCGFCKKKFEKLAKCEVAKIHNHWQQKRYQYIGTFVTVYLCDFCKEKEYIKSFEQRWDYNILDKCNYIDFIIVEKEKDAVWVNITEKLKPLILEEDFFNSSFQAR